MARRKDIDLDDLDNFDLDAELSKLDNNTFGEVDPPKNKREAIVRSMKDGGRGITDSLKPNKDNTTAFLKAAVPNSLRTEISDLSDLIAGPNGVKESLNQSLSELKKSGKALEDNIKKALPKDGKLYNAVDKIGKFLGLDKGDDLDSQMEKSNKALLEGITSELQNQFTKESTINLMNANKQNLANKSMVELLGTIASNTTTINTFNIEVTNNYYRKSLELQYKQLFTTREMLELNKKSLDTFSKQFETIIHNTSLPEFVKSQRSEDFKKTLRNQFDTNVQKFIFNEITPIKRIKENLSRRIKSIGSDFLEGINLANSVLEQREMLADMESMGMTKSYMLGNQIGGFFRDLIGKEIGERLASTKTGKKAIYNIKNAMADPSGYAAQKLKGLKRPGKDASWLDKLKYNAAKHGFGALRTLGAGVNDMNGAVFGRMDPNTAAIFDNKTQTSIVKVIPGLLSKIYGEIKSTRLGNKPEDNELRFDYSRQKLVTASRLQANIRKDFKLNLKRNTKYSISSIVDLYKEYSTNLRPEDLAQIGAGVLAYVTSRGAVLNPSIIIEYEYLKFFPGRIRKAMKKAATKILEAGIDQPYIIDNIRSSFSSIRNSIPDLGDTMDMLYTTGNLDVAENLGLLKRNSITGEFASNREGLYNFINYRDKNRVDNDFDNIAKNTESKYEPLADRFKRKKQEIKKKVTRLRRRIKVYRKHFFESEEYQNGYVKDFKKWVAGVVSVPEKDVEEVIQEELKEELEKSMVDKSKDYIKDTIKDPKKQFDKMKDQVVDKILGGTEEERQEKLAHLREQFFKSKEYQTGVVQDFDEWLAGIGLLHKKGGQGPTSTRMWRLLQHTWALDRKLFKLPFKAVGKALKLVGPTTKFGLKTSWKGLKGLGKLAGYGAAGAVLQPINLVREAMGMPAIGDDVNRSMDRNIIKGIMKTPKVAVIVGKGLAKIAKLFYKGLKYPSDFLFSTAKAANVSPEGQILAAGLDTVNTQLNELKPKTKNPFDTDGNGRRQGHWLDRMNFFKSKGKKESPEDQKKNKGIIQFMKDHKGLTLGAGMLLVGGLLSKLNISAEDIVSAVKAVGTGVGWVIDKLNTVGRYLGGFIDKIKNFLGFGEDGDSKFADMGGNIGTAAVAGGSLLAVSKTARTIAKLPVKATIGTAKLAAKTVGVGFKIVTTIGKFLQKHWGWGWLGDYLTSNAKKLASPLDSVIKGFNDIKTKLFKMKKAVTNPKIIKKVGKFAMKKVAAKVVGMVAAAATGIGAWITAGAVVWELAWTFYYMWKEDMTFWEALIYQVFGVNIAKDIFEDEDNKVESEANQIAKKAEEISENADTNNNKLDTGSSSDNEEQTEEKMKQELGQIASGYAGYINGLRKTNEERMKKQNNQTKTNSSTSAEAQMKAQSIQDMKNTLALRNQAANNPNYVPNKDSNFKNAQFSNVTYSKGSDKAKAASDIALKLTGGDTKSKGHCASHVRQSLEKAGYASPFGLGYSVGSAYMYNVKQANNLTPLEAMGFTKLNTDPTTHKPEDGDVAVIRNGPKTNPKHGHIAIYNKTRGKWLSDFIQPDGTDPSPYRNMKKRNAGAEYANYVSIYRDLSKDKTTTNVTGSSPDLENQSTDTVNTVIPDTAIASNNTSNSTLNAKQYNSSTFNDIKDTYSSSSNTTTVSAPTPTMNSGELRTISDTLSKSLRVQMYMADSLKELVELEKTNGTNAAGPKMVQANNATLPPPAIDLNRKQYS